MTGALALLLLVVGVVVVGVTVRRLALRQRAVARLDDALGVAGEDPDGPPPVRPLLRRLPWLPWALGLGLGLGLRLVVGLPWPFCGAFGLVLGVLAWLGEGSYARRRALAVEEQLADALDLMVGALRSGAGLLEALDLARQETRAPLREQLEEVTLRIRLGDDPPTTFHALAARVPLETFRLFTYTVAVHWEVGGSLAPTLSIVGKTVRDRLELSRRIAAQATQSRVSAIVFVALAYFLAAVMWRTNPGRMEAFLATSIGGGFAAGAIALQALGLLWMARAGRLEP